MQDTSAESSKEGYGTKRAILPMMMVMMIRRRRSRMMMI
jgi:hypothetical protein